MLELAHCHDVVCYLNDPEVALSLCFTKYHAKNRFEGGEGPYSFIQTQLVTKWHKTGFVFHLLYSAERLKQPTGSENE